MGKSGRRGNGEGSITKRKDGRWQGMYYVRTADGPERRYVYGRTRKATWDKIMKEMAQQGKRLVSDAGKITVGDFLDRWLNDSVKNAVVASTAERYEQVVRLHLKPKLGSAKLKDLSPLHVQGLYSEKLEEGLSPTTVQKVQTCCTDRSIRQ